MSPEEPHKKRGWRVGHQGRDMMYYEELRDGAWERIEISGEMLMGRAHHVIYFASSDAWQRYPAWARNRREEIIGRVTSEFREPDYEYYGVDDRATPPAAPPAPLTPASPASPPSSSESARRPGRPSAHGRRPLLIAVLLLLILTGGIGWFVTRSVARGETSLPVRFSGGNRRVGRAEKPVLFWGSIGVYAGIGIGAGLLGVLGMRESRKLEA